MKTFTFLIFLFLGSSVFSFTVPAFTRPVIDLAGMMSSETETVLNQHLTSIYQSGGPQIGVLTLPSLEEQTVEARAIEVFDNWKLGKKGKDDGVLLLIAKKEKKIRIEVGYGLEGNIPDAYAKRIIEDRILPYFRTGDFSNGIVQGIHQILTLALVQDPTLFPHVARFKQRPHRQIYKYMDLFLFILISCFILFHTIWRPFNERSGRGWGVGGGSDGGWGGWGGGGGSSGGGGASGGW
ncbi:MAG: TPM domain-containing protein [Deltaproteobacteria bacterium]